MPKRKVVQSISQSMAEGVHRFEKKTPERFHSSRHGEVYRPEVTHLQLVARFNIIIYYSIMIYCKLICRHFLDSSA